MAHIKIRKGLNIPLSGAPDGEIRRASPSREAAFDFTPFSQIPTHLLIKEGDSVLTGQPIIQEKEGGNRIWTSPATGIVKKILRGEKRALNTVVIEKTDSTEQFPCPKLNPGDPIEYLRETGLLSYIQMRPYCLPAHPKLKPRSIFIKAIESAPFNPPAELQLQANEAYFQEGLNFLTTICPVHLIYAVNSKAFPAFKGGTHHTAEGPHPISNPSLHIELLDPILKNTDVVWTLDTCGVIAIGLALCKAVLHPGKIIALAGDGIPADLRGYYKVSTGADLKSIIPSAPNNSRIISGDPLMGEERSIDGHLGFFHTAVCAIPEIATRKTLHFFRWKSPSFTATKTYSQNKTLSTRLNGEERAFIDPNVYDQVMPLQISTVPLIKAILAEDYESAETLGSLEIAPEDFALPTFICPSKIEMVEIVRRGLAKIAKENLNLPS